MPTPVNPPRLIEDDYTGEWSEDIGDVFDAINKSGKDVATSLATQVVFSQLGAQKIVLNSVVMPDLWTDAPLEAGVTDYGAPYEPAGYYKDEAGVVWIRGLVIRATVGDIFRLPEGFRPSYGVHFATVVNDGAEKIGFLRIDDDGWVKVLLNAPVNFGSIKCCFPSADMYPGVPSCFPLKIVSKLTTGKASVVLLGSVIDQNAQGGQLVTLGYNNVAWHNDTGFDGSNKQNYIIIDNIAGLIKHRTYQITLWAFPEQ